MRRRIARVLRVGLFVFGLTALLSIPASFLGVLEIHSPWPRDITNVRVGQGFIGVLSVYIDVDDPFVIRIIPIPDYPDWVERDWMDAVRPSFETVSFHALDDSLELAIPLWLLSFICLAWPVTSFILARRKPKRGFPVELAPSSGVGSGPPLPPGEGGGGRREATG